MRERVIIECDVVVVGTGAAGMMAALTAAENGAKVYCLSKMPLRHQPCSELQPARGPVVNGGVK